MEVEANAGSGKLVVGSTPDEEAEGMISSKVDGAASVLENVVEVVVNEAVADEATVMGAAESAVASTTVGKLTRDAVSIGMADASHSAASVVPLC